MQKYVVIDLYTGFVWWTGDAENATDACRKTDEEAHVSPRQFEEIPASDASSTNGGFAVHSATPGFDVSDGQNREQISAAQAFPLVGYFRAIHEDA